VERASGSENVGGKEAAVEPTGMYSRRFAGQTPAPPWFDDVALRNTSKRWHPTAGAACRRLAAFRAAKKLDQRCSPSRSRCC